MEGRHLLAIVVGCGILIGCSTPQPRHQNNLADGLQGILASIAEAESSRKTGAMDDFVSEKFGESRQLVSGSFSGCGEYDKFTCVDRKTVFDAITANVRDPDTGRTYNAACLRVSGTAKTGDELQISYIFLLEEDRWKLASIWWLPFPKDGSRPFTDLCDSSTVS